MANDPLEESLLDREMLFQVLDFKNVVASSPRRILPGHLWTSACIGCTFFTAFAHFGLLCVVVEGGELQVCK